MVRLVQGVGINDGKYPTKVNKVQKKEYSLWKSMLSRCYSASYQDRQPTYIGCTVSDNFKHYSYFYEWCVSQIGFKDIGYQLDKDLLIKGNKMYSESICIFIPRELNNLIENSKATRGMLPLGVNKSRNKFKAECSVNGTTKYLGVFITPDEAFQTYKTFKENYIKELAEKYKDTIDPRAYQALINYEVSIDD